MTTHYVILTHHGIIKSLFLSKSLMTPPLASQGLIQMQLFLTYFVLDFTKKNWYYDNDFKIANLFVCKYLSQVALIKAFLCRQILYFFSTPVCSFFQRNLAFFLFEKKFRLMQKLYSILFCFLLYLKESFLEQRYLPLKLLCFSIIFASKVNEQSFHYSHFFTKAVFAFQKFKVETLKGNFR